MSALYTFQTARFTFAQVDPGHPMRTPYTVAVAGKTIGHLRPQADRIDFYPFGSTLPAFFPDQEEIDQAAEAMVQEARRRREARTEARNADMAGKERR